MADPFIGEIKMVGFTYDPYGWEFCSGQIFAITQYQSLYALLGTKFGGNGTTTFGIPDFRGRVPMHFGSGPGLTTRVIGEKLGQEHIQLTIPNMPLHTHNVTYTAPTYGVSGTVKPKAQYGPGTKTSNPTDNYLSSINSGYSDSSNQTMGEAEVDLSIVNTTPGTVYESATGGTQSHNNMQPYLVVNFIIATLGLWPDRK